MEEMVLVSPSVKATTDGREKKSLFSVMQLDFRSAVNTLLKYGWALRNGGLSVYEYTYSQTPLIILVNFIMQSMLHAQNNCITQWELRLKTALQLRVNKL